MSLRFRLWLLAALSAGWVGSAACGSSSSADAGAPSLEPADANLPGEDASAPGVDAAQAAPDAGPIFGGPGPWPTDALTTYGAAQGLDPGEIVDVSTDEAHNLWAVSHGALFLLRSGESTFRKYTAADGLHLGTAEPPGITAVAGGAANEVFVGYQGVDEDGFNVQTDPRRFRGKYDRVQLRPDGTLEVDFYNVHNNDAVESMAGGACVPDSGVTDWTYNEDRNVARMLYDHQYHRGTLYVGFSHGVQRVDPGRPDPITGDDFADHVHPLVINPKGTPRMGEWRALALDPARSGALWMGGRWTAGAMGYTPSLFEWTNNNYDCPPDYPRHPFQVAFSNSAAGVNDVRPVFEVTPGDSIYLWGIAALSDGTVYFASGPGYDSAYAGPFGIAMWRPGSDWTYLSPEADLGLPGRRIVDLQRLPDDTVLVALEDGSLWRWNPAPRPAGRNLGAVSGLPGAASRVYVDAMVEPPAVFVATRMGIALVRPAAVPSGR